ncbi:alpha/beta fold hydrolase [Larkinella soli]|uniref:alpha/beta fold hydrolase n=1 Tax=Larkinella soli TaxID=1770527 RepID=UPI000FFBA12D|nr:alpha/beta hydrolase [Larkinella soli]
MKYYLLTLFVWQLSIQTRSRVQKTDSLVLNNAVLYYHTYGTGTPIVVLSGGPGISAEQESDVVDSLAKSYRVILFEQRGTGRSWTKPMDSTTINIHSAINDLDVLRKRLGVTKLNIYGHSWGGMLAAAYAASYPTRVGLLILNGSGEINLAHTPIIDASTKRGYQLSDTSAINYWLDSPMGKQNPQLATRELRRIRVANSVYDRSKAARVFAQVEKGVRNQAMSSLMWRSLRREGFNLESTLKAYKGPALIIYGWQDPTGATTFYQLSRSLPQAEVKGINEAGHFVSVEQPTLFFSAVNDFLKRHLSDSKSH